MDQPVIAQRGPYTVDVETGKKYTWCDCGRSKNQPFCDGSHSGTEFAPVMFEAEKSETVYFCGCKRTGDAPRCDGTHSSL